jgi:trehalose utilization protein
MNFMEAMKVVTKAVPGPAVRIQSVSTGEVWDADLFYRPAVLISDAQLKDTYKIYEGPEFSTVKVRAVKWAPDGAWVAFSNISPDNPDWNLTIELKLDKNGKLISARNV